MDIKANDSLQRNKGVRPSLLTLLFFYSLIFFALAKIVPRKSTEKQRAEMYEAAQIMNEAQEILRSCLSERGLTVALEKDINGTGLIGIEWSEMTTTIGNLESKRTTTNPNMAALVVYLLREAGVREGDSVAVGGSGSFPALILAVMSAAKVMEIKPLIVCSLGASQWGANRPDFHFLDMFECLRRDGLFDVRPLAVSLGGEKDIAEEMPSDMVIQLVKDIEDSGIPFIREPELEANVRNKMQIYEAGAGERGIRCFINIGGNWSNLGTDSEILNLKPGLTRIRKIPPREKRGIVFEMAARGIPVLHLLFIKGLVDGNGLPWDPSPLPRPGSGSIYDKPMEDQPLFIVLAGIYLSVMVLLAWWYTRAKRRE